MGTDEKTMNGVNPSNDDKGGGPGSVTLCVNALKAGDLAAAGPLWDRYFVELVRLARVRLARKRPQTLMSDEEDAALNALDSFYRGLALERFPKLDDREDLWRILVTITSRKVDDQIEHELALKRGGRMKRIQSFEEEDWVLTRLSPTTVTPDVAAEIVEEFERRLDSLDDDVLRRIALLKLEGYTSKEIAQQLGVALRTVARKLDLIRDQWRKEPRQA